MSQVKAEFALNLLKYFRWLVQSHKKTLVSFYIAQKQYVKDSGWLSISGNNLLCKQTSNEETDVPVVPRNRLLILQSLSYRNSPVGKASVKIMSELSSYVAWICHLQDNQSLTHMCLPRSSSHSAGTVTFSGFPEWLLQMSSQLVLTMCSFWV